MQIILVNCDEEVTFLNIWFPVPSPYPHPYIQLNELMTTVEIAPETYDRITDIPGDPNRALGYILHHFNIDRVPPPWRLSHAQPRTGLFAAGG